MMKSRGLLLIHTICLVFLSFHVFAQSGNPDMDRYFTRKMEKAHVIGLQAASIQDGELVWQGSYGLREYKSNKGVNDSTLFMIASSTKPVTALGVLLLYEKGKLDLDAPVNSYMPFEIINPNFPDSAIRRSSGMLDHTK